MTLFESASAIGSQVLANWLVGDNMEKNISSTSTAAILLAMMSIVCFNGGLTGTAQTSAIRGYRASFYVYILGGKSLLFFMQIILPFLSRKLISRAISNDILCYLQVVLVRAYLY